MLPNLPGHPDHQARYARRGLLPWPPGEECECKGCRERYGTERTDRKFMAPDEVTLSRVRWRVAGCLGMGASRRGAGSRSYSILAALPSI